MIERDWEKDWEICEQATPGPWEIEGIGGIYMDGKRDAYTVTHNGTRLNKPHFSYHDARFIAEARQALPYWLQRVRELETELRGLRHIKARAQKCFEVLLRALQLSECGSDDFRKPLVDAGLVAAEDYFILSDGWYDAEAVAFAWRVVRRILGEPEEDAE